MGSLEAQCNRKGVRGALRRSCHVAVFSILAYPAIASAAMLIDLGLEPGAGWTTPHAISADGKTVVGEIVGPAGREAFRWRRDEGIVGLGYGDGEYSNTMAYGVSADGETIVGSALGPRIGSVFAYSDPVRWSQADGMQSLTPEQGKNGSAHGVSDDGRTMVGSYDGQAVVWSSDTTDAIGMRTIDGLGSSAQAITGDGKTVAGLATTAQGIEAVMWPLDQGRQSLGELQGGAHYARALDLAPDGKTVVGSSSSSSSHLEAFRWTADSGMQGLGFLSGDDVSVANAVSADGNRVVGWSSGPRGMSAFLWDEDNGMRPLKDVLQWDYGLDVDGWYLGEAVDISDDGRTIVGDGNGAWLVTGLGQMEPRLPPPPSAAELTFLAEAAYSGHSGLVTFHQVDLDGHDACPARGFCARVFSDRAGDNIVLAIAGTNDLQDWIGANPSFLRANGRPTGVFRDYTAVASDMLSDLRGAYPDSRITLTGHSLGGAVAELLADASGLDAVVFNAPGAAAAREFLTEELEGLSDIANPGGTGTFSHYRVYGDLISTVGEHIAEPITLEPPIPAWQVRAVPFGTAKAMHEISTVHERLFNEAPVSGDIGPTLAGLLAFSVGTHIVLSETGRSLGPYGWILPITNVVVGVADFVWVDPQDLDLYHFAVEPGSPYVRTVTFPFLLDVDALFSLETRIDDLWTSLGLFGELETYDFGPEGVDQFRFFISDAFTGLPPAAIDPFAFGLTFASDGILTATLTAVSTQAAAIPEPMTVALLSLGLVLINCRRFKPRGRARGSD